MWTSENPVINRRQLLIKHLRTGEGASAHVTCNGIFAFTVKHQSAARIAKRYNRRENKISRKEKDEEEQKTE
jgi:hypothetical protein